MYFPSCRPLPRIYSPFTNTLNTKLRCKAPGRQRSIYLSCWKHCKRRKAHIVFVLFMRLFSSFCYPFFTSATRSSDSISLSRRYAKSACFVIMDKSFRIRHALRCSVFLHRFQPPPPPLHCKVIPLLFAQIREQKWYFAYSLRRIAIHKSTIPTRIRISRRVDMSM